MNVIAGQRQSQQENEQPLFNFQGKSRWHWCLFLRGLTMSIEELPIIKERMIEAGNGKFC